MTILSVIRVSINLGEIPLNAYRVLLDNDEHLDLMAGRSVTDVIDQHPSSLLRKMGVKSLKDLPHADSALPLVKADTGETFIPVSIKDACFYWGKMSQSKNEKATAVLVACAIESIERRIDAVIQAEKQPEVAPIIKDKIDALNVAFEGNMKDWVEGRAYSISMHPWFQQHCVANHYPAAKVHDIMTKAIFGQTAEEARLKPLVLDNLDSSIGLNHQEDPERQEILAKVKRKFCLLQNGTWQEKVNRAVKAVMA